MTIDCRIRAAEAPDTCAVTILPGAVGTIEASEAPDLCNIAGEAGIVGLLPQSDAFNIWQAFFDRASADAFFANYTIRPTTMLPVQANLLPYLGIYMGDEDMRPDGDANAGMIRFNHSGKIGFSIIIANNNRRQLLQQVDAAFWRIMGLLWTDQDLMNVLINSNPEGVGIESIPRGQRKFVWGSTGANNETPFCECRYDVTAFWRSEWWPPITDTLDEIDIKTGMKIGETPAQMAQREQVEVDIMLQSSGTGKGVRDGNVQVPSPYSAKTPARPYGTSALPKAGYPRRTTR
jgi:hypothetical protein